MGIFEEDSPDSQNPQRKSQWVGLYHMEHFQQAIQLWKQYSPLLTQCIV